MARKPHPRSWLQVFQKQKSESESRRLPSDQPNSVMLEENPDTIEPSESKPSIEPSEPENRVKAFHRKYTAVAVERMASTSQVAFQRLGPFVKAWRWQLIWLGIFGVFGGTALLAFVWISNVPPAVECKQISSWSTDSERLYCAQQAAQSGKPEQLIDAIKLVKDWTNEHPLYGQARFLLQDWSNAVLIIARDRVAQRDLNGGISLASQIPRSSPNYKEAQAVIERWKDEHRRGQVIYNKIQAALKKRNWDLASEHTGELGLINDPSWQDRISEIRQQTNHEKAAWKFLQDARNFAKENPPEKLGQAIAITDPIDRKTYVWSLHAQAEVVRWRNKVFSLAIAQLDKQNIPGASMLVNSIPASVQLTSANRDLIRLVRGKEVDAEKDYRAPALEKLPPVMLAANLVRQIDEQSPFYSRAKVLLPRLEQRSQDLLQLNTATTLANLQQVSTLKLAIVQAKAVKPGRPGRTHAQTLIAMWQKELQTMEDRPVLRQAEHVAKSGKLGPLRSAVALANLVSPKRALRQEAQTNIATWTYQIQVIEDRPIIAEARTIADSGRLGRAIDVAAKIRPGRALYGEAQNLIGGWIYELQIIEDRPIIAEASALAERGSLTRAIGVASEIAPGRALYREAQALISRWAAEREEIWRQRERANAPEDDSSEEPDPADQSEPSTEPESTPLQ